MKSSVLVLAFVATCQAQGFWSSLFGGFSEAAPAAPPAQPAQPAAAPATAPVNSAQYAAPAPAPVNSTQYAGSAPVSNAASAPVNSTQSAAPAPVNSTQYTAAAPAPGAYATNTSTPGTSSARGGNTTAPAASGPFAPTVSNPSGSQILPPGTMFLARHTTRDDNEAGMDYTQCQTKVNKGPNDNVIGVDSRLFGSTANGEITPICGVVAQMRNPKTGQLAYGVILDRIWQNPGTDTQFDVSPAISKALGYGGHNIGNIEVTIIDDFPSSYSGARDFANMWKAPQDKAYGYPVCPGPPADPSKAELKNGLRVIYNDKLKTHCVFEAGKRPLTRATAI